MWVILLKDKLFDYLLIEDWRNENVECVEVKFFNFIDESVLMKSFLIFILGIFWIGIMFVE